MKNGKRVFKWPHSMSIDEHDTTSVSFIPVCDSCNWALSELHVSRDENGYWFFDPCACPNCRKIINRAIMFLPTNETTIDYEEK